MTTFRLASAFKGTRQKSTKLSLAGPCTADEVIQAAYGLMAFDMGPMMHLGYRAPVE